MNNKKPDELNIYYKCSVLSGFFIAVISLLLIPLYFFNLGEIPAGILLGGAYGVLCYSITGLLENKRGEYYKWAVLIAVFRFFFLAVLLILVALCYYKWEVKIFNIFSVVGGYLICLVVLISLFIIKDKKEKRVDGQDN